MSDKSNLITISIDGQEVQAEAGKYVIRVAEEMGITIPRFCDHPLLDPVAACRACLVDVEGARKPEAACSLAVRPGLVIKTQRTSELARTMQADVLELILVNHPLDCPQCDKGGECPLQDQALAHGRPETRMAERKSTYQKAMPISPLIKLDRERCVLCARCTRFSKQISGDPFIELMERGALEQVGIYEDKPYKSHFSGNVTQICPVGALTSTTYRFTSRPFDLHKVPGIAFHDASGANLRHHVRKGVIERVMARTNLSVNDSWIDDATRYGFEFINSDARIVAPLVRNDSGNLVATSWIEAVDKTAKTLDGVDGERIGVLAGTTIADEDAYALSRFSRDVLNTDNVDFRMNPSADELEVLPTILAEEGAKNSDIDNATTVIIAGLEPHEENPTLFLRLRKNWRKRSLKIVVVGPVLGRLEEVAWQWIPTNVGGEKVVLDKLANGDDERLNIITDNLGDNVVVLAGERLAQSSGALQAAHLIAEKRDGKFGWVPRYAASRGSLQAGLMPGVLPGGRNLDNPSAIANIWKNIPSKTGVDTVSMLEKAANGELDVLFLLGADPLANVADTTLVEKAFENTTVIATAMLRTESAVSADIILAAAAPTERVGSYANWEGRRQAWPMATGAVGSVLPEWDILRQISRKLGKDLGWTNANDVRREASPLMGDSSGAAPSKAQSNTVSKDGEGAFAVEMIHQLLEPHALLGGADELLQSGDGPQVWIHPNSAGDITSGDVIKVSAPTGEGEAVAYVTENIRENTLLIPLCIRGSLGDKWHRADIKKVESVAKDASSLDEDSALAKES